jgi:hypothetical protein
MSGVQHVAGKGMAKATSNQLQGRSPDTSRNVAHVATFCVGSLQSAESLSDVLCVYWGSCLFWWIEQAGFSTNSFSSLLILVAATLSSLYIFGILDSEGFFCQSLDNLKGEETQDIDDVVVWLAVSDDAETSPFAEAFALAESERGLTALAPV